MGGRRPARFVGCLALLLAGCTDLYGDGCTDPQVFVSRWEGTPGVGVQWDDLDGSFPGVEELIESASVAGNATGQVPDPEYRRFERALDAAWEETGRPGSRPNVGNVDVVEYQAKEWALYDERVCA